MNQFTELDFIANWLYQADSRKKGRPAGARWWCLREDIRTEYRLKARGEYLEWAQSERLTAERQGVKYG